MDQLTSFSSTFLNDSQKNILPRYFTKYKNIFNEFPESRVTGESITVVDFISLANRRFIARQTSVIISNERSDNRSKWMWNKAFCHGNVFLLSFHAAVIIK